MGNIGIRLDTLGIFKDKSHKKFGKLILECPTFVDFGVYLSHFEKYSDISVLKTTVRFQVDSSDGRYKQFQVRYDIDFLSKIIIQN